MSDGIVHDGTSLRYMTGAEREQYGRTGRVGDQLVVIVKPIMPYSIGDEYAFQPNRGETKDGTKDD